MAITTRTRSSWAQTFETRRRALALVLAPLAVFAVLVAGLWVFTPWRAFTSSSIDEPLPHVPAAPPAGASESAAPPPVPVVLADGAFVSQEHETSGVAKVVRLADGSRVLRLENLATSDGPDVHVWLTDRAVGGAWNSYDDGRHVPLGKIKATHGNQNYPIPPDVSLAGLRSVVIWCDRFNVAFGSAAVTL